MYVAKILNPVLPGGVTNTPSIDIGVSILKRLTTSPGVEYI